VSGVRKFRVKTKLAAEAARAGGITANEALKRADAGLEPLREPCLVTVDRCLGEIDRRFGVAASGRTQEEFEDLYVLSSQIIDSSLGLPNSGIEHAARALCDLTDLSLEKGIRDWQAIDVHVETLKLLRLSGQAFSQAQREAVLEGLKKVTLKRVGDPNALPAAG
jgi:hypothetical protein